jgi:uncharacterized protein YjbI with pentapeptide repeats
MPATEDTEIGVVGDDASFFSEQTFRRCQFADMIIPHAVHDVVFEDCSFRSVRFRGALEDVQAVACTFHDVQFGTAGVKDCSFRRCTFTKLRGTLVARRCAWSECTFANARPTNKSTACQCRWRDCTITDSDLSVIALTDCKFLRVKMQRVSLVRSQWRRCGVRGARFEACAFASARCGGNTWDACVWKDCGGAYASFVGDRFAKSRVVGFLARSAHFASCTFRMVRDEGSDYSHSRWEATQFVDCPWINVMLNEARCNRVTWTNCTHEGVTDQNTLYSNVERVRKPTLAGKVHFVGEARAVTTTLYSKHHGLQATESDNFRLRVGTAQEVDFVAVRPTPSWWSFGFSAPADAHDLVSHVTIGPHTYYRSSERYALAGGTQHVLGYRRRIVRRAHSR